MEVKIPGKIEDFTHGGIVEQLLEENKKLKKPSRTEWMNHVPDLVHRNRRIAVEVELTDLTKGWGQCLSYHRLDSEEVHLVLPPSLYQKYIRDEKEYVIKNPIPNIHVYSLPSIPEQEEEEEKETRYLRRTIERGKNKKKYMVDEAEFDLKGLKKALKKQHSYEDTTKKKEAPTPEPPVLNSILGNKIEELRKATVSLDGFMIECPHCNHKIPENLNICWYCGGILSEQLMRLVVRQEQK